MDNYILISTSISFFSYLLMHTIIFRLVDKKKVLIWLMNTCLLGGIFPFLISGILTYFFPLTGYSFLWQFFIISCISFILYGFLSVLYILGPFGLIESSLRLKLLEVIAKAGSTGVNESYLLKIYNKRTIIQKRLDRFTTSKDFIYHNGIYRMQNHLSYFIVQTFIFENIKKIFQTEFTRRNT